MPVRSIRPAPPARRKTLRCSSTARATSSNGARALAQTGRNREAIRLAEQADADAALASAMSRAARSNRALAEVEASVRALRDELGRSPAGSAATPANAAGPANTGNTATTDNPANPASPTHPAIPPRSQP